MITQSRRNIRHYHDHSWGWLLRNLIVPIGDSLSGQDMMAHLAFLERAQWWTQHQIADVQSKLLRKLIQVSWNEVPLYRELMTAAGVEPRDVQSADDLAQLPVVTKDMFRAGYPEKTTRETSQRTYEASTSGSTGKNFCVQEDAQTAGRYRAAFLLAVEWAGWQIGDPHVQTGMTLRRSLDRKLKDLFFRTHYISAYQLDDSSLQSTLNILEKFRIQHLWGYASSLHVIAKYARKVGWNRKLSSVVSWGDMLYSHYRSTIEDAFGAPVFDTYGCAEGIQVAAQCERGSYHIHALDTIAEVVDDQGVPVPAGSFGNIVLTRLHPGPMPFIRYKVGDTGVASKELYCACGRGLPMLQSINGRDTDIILTPSGNRLIVHFFTGILEHFSEVDSFQVVQQSLDSIVLRIVPAAGFTEEISRQVVSALVAKGASDLRIDIEIVSHIPLSPAAKHRFVVSTVTG